MSARGAVGSSRGPRSFERADTALRPQRIGDGESTAPSPALSPSWHPRPRRSLPTAQEGARTRRVTPGVTAARQRERQREVREPHPESVAEGHHGISVPAPRLPARSDTDHGMSVHDDSVAHMVFGPCPTTTTGGLGAVRRVRPSAPPHGDGVFLLLAPEATTCPNVPLASPPPTGSGVADDPVNAQDSASTRSLWPAKDRATTVRRSRRRR